MGQIATGCALGYLDFRHGDRDWRGNPAGACGLVFGLRRMAAMQATAPAYAAPFAAYRSRELHCLNVRWTPAGNTIR